MTIIVLRLGHRFIRDDRTTTHLFLAARAFGADAALYSGRRDLKVEEGLRRVNATWGGSFELAYSPNWVRTLEHHKSKGWKLVHLTMYGTPLQETIDEIRSSPSNKIVVVGGSKVPRKAYELADWNIAVTSQPHSEISALSVFLHELFKGEELSKPFLGGELEIVPQAKGKRVRRKGLVQGPSQGPMAS